MTSDTEASTHGSPRLEADVAADARARELASDPRRSVLLQAPAGSGKTTVLTERLLRLLAEVNQPEEILAITFTRKAAAEMRARVLKALRGEGDTTSVQGARMHAFAQAALARAAQRGWNLAQDPGRLRIQTIDSFNFRLATQLTVTAKAGGSLVITERPHELYNRAARQTLASAEDDTQLAADVELLFERLDNNWGNVQRLLADMLRERGHWLRYVLGHKPSALCHRITRSLGAIVRDHVYAASALLPPTLRSQASALPGVGQLGTGLEHARAWKRLSSLTLTAKCEWRKAVSKTLGYEYERPEAREALKRAIESLSLVGGLREALAEIACLPAAELSQTDAMAIEALSRVLRFAAVHLQAEFAVNGRVDHTYVAGAARESLTESGLPTDLALRTGLFLRHILVDEFQDTSLAQFDLIQTLIAGWEEADGRTLFVVGDPMQSIYQFREAEVGLFLRARESGIGTVRLQPLRLTRNFRSVPALIDWVNSAFNRLFPDQDDLRASAVSFTRSVAGKGSGQGPTDVPVRVRLFDCEDRSTETIAITERIAELRAADPKATIAVLVASRSHAAPIITSLEARRIDAVGVDLVPLRELSIIRDLVALMRATHHLGDRTAWLAVLRAPWCGLTLRSLTALSQRRDSLLVWEAMSDPQRLSRCAVEDVVNLTRVRKVLEQSLHTRNGLPLADWLELTWVRLGAADAYPAEELRHGRAFLAALSERVASGEWSGPQDLDSLLSDLFAQPQASAANPVQLMTIHRAKGLEFDHVFVPSLDRELNRGREPLLRWLDLPRTDGESDLIMAPVPTIGDDEGGEVSGYLKRLTSRRAQNEQVRLIYVAATRAKQTLEFSAAPKVKNDGTIAPRNGTLLAALWPAVENAATADLLARNLAKSLGLNATRGAAEAAGASQSDATGALRAREAGASKADVAGGLRADVTDASRADAAGALRAGAAGASKADVAGASRADAAGALRADVADASRADIADTLRADVAGALRADVADASRADAAGASRADAAGALRADAAGALRADAAGALRADVAGALRADVAGALRADVTGALRADAADASRADAAGASRTGAAAAARANGDTPPKPIRRLVGTWSLPSLVSATQLPHLPVSHQSLEPPEFSWVGETARHIGTVVHAGLESYASRQGLPTRVEIEADRSFYTYQLRRHGVPERDLPYATSMVVDALTRTVTNERGRWIFAPEHREAQSEWALTGIAAGRLTNVVIDRSFVDPTGTRWVIDFKTSRHEGGGLDAFVEQEMARYRPQLETYVALARGISETPVRAALYFPLLDVFRELERLG